MLGQMQVLLSQYTVELVVIAVAVGVVWVFLGYGRHHARRTSQTNERQLIR